MVIHHAQEPIALLATDGRVALANEHFTDLLAIPADGVLLPGGPPESTYTWRVQLTGRDGAPVWTTVLRQPHGCVLLPRQRGVSATDLCALVRLQSESVHREREVTRKNMELESARAQILAQAAVLQTLATTDVLTGLANRRSILDTLEAVWRNHAQPRRCLGVLMLDVDHFKRVNDEHGHAAGDAVLIAIARVAAGAVRSGDLFGRYGGEEFVAVLPDCDPARALAVAERVRLAVEGVSVTWQEHTLQVTASIGVATTFPEGTPEGLLSRADACTYAAKRAGRNRVVA